MVSFLNPGLLWALPLTAAPIIVHLFFLRRARRMSFGDLTLLRRAYLKSLPASRLRQWLLLAVRCLVLAGLILAFARPVLQPQNAAGAAQGEDEARVVMLLDTSYSMGYRAHGKTRLELAQAAGENILQILRPQDRTSVVAFSDRVEFPISPEPLQWAKDIPSAISVLKRQTAGSRGTDFVPPLRAAYELLKQSKARRRVIMLLSDNAAHGWHAGDAALSAEQIPAYDPSVLLLGVDWPDRPENAAIMDVELSHDSPDKPRFSAYTRIDGATREDWNLDLFQEDRRVEQRHIQLISGRQSPVEFAVPSPKESGVWGHFQMREDALPGDDIFYYSFWMQPKPKILLVYGSPHSMEVGHGGYFLKKLFTDVQGSLLPYELEIADSVRLNSLNLKDYRAVLCMDFRSIPAEMAGALESYVRGGGGLWLIVGRNAEPGAYRPLSKMLPVKVGDLMDTASQDIGLKPDAVIGGVQNLPFSWKDFELQNVAVRRSYVLEPETNSKVWFRNGAGRPLMISGSFGQGQVLIWGSSLDIDWTNLGVKPVFAAWADLALGQLSSYSKRLEWRTLKIGEPIVRVWGLSEAAPAFVRVRGPQGRSATLQVVHRRVEYTPELPGIYFLDSSGNQSATQTEAYAVNLDRSGGESDLSVARSLPWKLLNVEALREDFTGALYGREARTAAMGLVVLLLAIETLLANPKIPSP